MLISKNNILDASIWLIGGSAYVTFVGFISSIFLMRILDPVVFGVIAAIAAINGLFEIFRDFGVGRCIIFSKDDELVATSNMSFIVNIVVGLFFSAALFMCATIIAQRLNIEHKYINAVRLLSLNPLINSALSTFDNYLQRKLLFRQKVITETISTTTYSIIAIVLAYCNWGIWSIIIAQQISSIILTLGFYLNVNKYWKPEISLKKLNFSKTLHMGGHFTLSSIIVYLYNNIDNFIVALLLGPKQLGYYSRSYNYAMIPSSFIGSVIAKITGPIYNNLAETDDKLAKAVQIIFKLLGIIIPPLFMFVIVFAKDLVLLIIGPKWLPMIIPFQVLLVSFGIKLINTSAANVFAAKGKIYLISLVPLVYLTTLTLLIYPSTKLFGIIGTSIAVLATAIIGGTISMVAAANITNINMINFAKPILKTCFFCVVVWIVFRCLLDSSIISLNWLILKIMLYALLYAGFTTFMLKKEMKEIIQFKKVWVERNV